MAEEWPNAQKMIHGNLLILQNFGIDAANTIKKIYSNN